MDIMLARPAMRLIGAPDLELDAARGALVTWFVDGCCKEVEQEQEANEAQRGGFENTRLDDICSGHTTLFIYLQGIVLQAPGNVTKIVIMRHVVHEIKRVALSERAEHTGTSVQWPSRATTVL